MTVTRALWLAVLALAINACSESPTAEAVTTSAAATELASALNQPAQTANASFGNLFTDPQADCLLLSADEIATILKLASGAVEQTSDCRFDVTLTDGSRSPIHFRRQVGAKSGHANAIQDSLWKPQESALSNVWLVFHPNQGFLVIINPEQDGVIRLSYGPPLAMRGLTDEQKLVRKGNGIALANAILRKFAE